MQKAIYLHLFDLQMNAIVNFGEKSFANFNWFNFKKGDKVYINDTLLGYFNCETPDSVHIDIHLAK